MIKITRPFVLHNHYSITALFSSPYLCDFVVISEQTKAPGQRVGWALGTFTALENLDYQHCIVVPVAVVVFIIAFKDEWRGHQRHSCKKCMKQHIQKFTNESMQCNAACIKKKAIGCPNKSLFDSFPLRPNYRFCGFLNVP